MINLKQLMFDKGLSQLKLGKILKIKQPEVSKLINGKRDINQTLINLLIEHFGEETVNAYTIINNKQTPQVAPHTATIIPAEIVEEIKAEAIEDAEKRLIEQISIPIVPSEIINKTDVNIRQFIEKKGHDLKQFDPREITNGSIGSIEILDTSMWPTFSTGDYIFFTFLPDKRMITDGKTYLFDFNKRPTMVRKVKVEGDKLRLIADNPDYGDIVTSFDQIYNIADIVGMFRHFFEDQHTKIEALRRHKEDQIDNLIREIRENGKRTDRMMEQNFELMQKLMEKLL